MSLYSPPQGESTTNQVLAPVILTLPRLSRMSWRETEHQRLPASRSAAARGAALRLSGPKGPLERSRPIKSCSTRATASGAAARASRATTRDPARRPPPIDRWVSSSPTHAARSGFAQMLIQSAQTVRLERTARTDAARGACRVVFLSRENDVLDGKACGLLSDSGRGRMTRRNVARS